MSSSQSTSDSQETIRKVLCLFLQEIEEDQTRKLKSSKSIFFHFFIPEVDGYSFDSLTNQALSGIQQSYPGVKMIDLYLSNNDYNKYIKNPNSTKAYICLNDPDLYLTLSQLDQLCNATFYFRITNLFGIKGFTRVEEVQCNFKTSLGNSSFVYMLLPNVSLLVDTFKEALNNYIKLSRKIEGKFSIIIEDKNKKPVDYVSESSLKDIIITLILKLSSFKELCDRIPEYNHQFNDEEELKGLLLDFYKPGISFHTYHFQTRTLLIGFPSHTFDSQNEFSTILNLIDARNKVSDDSELYAHIFGLIGPSGCGKTSTLYELGKQYPLIYVNVYNPVFYEMLIKPALKVENFITITHYNSFLDQNNDFLNRLNVVFSRFFYALYIYYYKRHFKEKRTNTDLINEQFNGASSIIKGIWSELEEDKDYTDELQNNLSIHPNELFNIAFDEAQVLCGKCRSLYSCSHASSNPDMTKESSHDSEYRRHLYYALTNFFITFRINTFFAGTSFLLKECTEFISQIGKGPDAILTVITNFGLCTKPMQFLKRYINIDDIYISDKLRQKVEKRRGNWRYTFSIINSIINILHNDNDKTKITTKSTIFRDAVKVSEKEIKSLLTKNSGNVKKIINSFQNNTQFLLAIAKSCLFAEYSKTQEIEESFRPKDIDICCDYFHIYDIIPTGNSDLFTAKFFLYEPIIKEVLGLNIKTFSECLQRECTNTSPVFCHDGSTQGKIFELLCLYQLCRFNGIFVSDLPFVKNIQRLPKWAKTTKLLANSFGTSWEYFKFNDIKKLDKCSDNSNCYPDYNGNFYEGMLATEYDAQFILRSSDFVGCVLKPQNLTRPDGFLPMIDKDDKEIHPLLFGIKCYSSFLDKKTSDDNTNSTNPNLFFTKSDKKKSKQTTKALQILSKAKKSKKQSLFQGSLRIHILISPNKLTKRSCASKGDILVYITKDNLKDFFDFKEQSYLASYFEKYFNFVIETHPSEDAPVENQECKPKTSKQNARLVKSEIEYYVPKRRGRPKKSENAKEDVKPDKKRVKNEVSVFI